MLRLRTRVAVALVRGRLHPPRAAAMRPAARVMRREQRHAWRGMKRRPARPDELEHQGDELEGQALELPADHRPRTDPYPDELDQLFCEACETLCSPGRPCHCCWVGQLDAQEGD